MFGEISAKSYISQAAEFRAADDKISFANEIEKEQYKEKVRINLIGRTDDGYRAYLEKIAIMEWEQLHKNISNALSWDELPTFVRADFIAVVKAQIETETKGI